MAVNARSPNATRERIHDAGLTLFNEHGYTGTTVRELADACALTPGAIYNHYASKEALLFAIVDRVHDEADAILSQTLRTASRAPAAQLEALAAAFTAFHIARPRETRVANRDYIYLPGGERESIVRRRRRVRALFADVLRDGERDGSFSFGELGSEDAVQAAEHGDPQHGRARRRVVRSGGAAQRAGHRRAARAPGAADRARSGSGARPSSAA